MDCVTFTISKGVKGLNIKAHKYNTYNKYEVPPSKLFDAMSELADVFNNILEIGIMFEVE